MDVDRKHIQRMLRGFIAALPMTYLLRRRREPILPYILGGIGLAVVGGTVAIMMLSPRTRDRARLAAKNTYGKLNTRVGELRGRIPSEVDRVNSFTPPREYPTSGL
jgi:hypothetical protein